MILFSARCKRYGQCSRSATSPTLPALAEGVFFGMEEGTGEKESDFQFFFQVP